MIVSSLRKLIRKEYLRSILVPLIVIEVMLLIAYFWSNTYVSKATQSALVQETKANIAEISKRAAKVIDLEFESIASITSVYAKIHENFFKDYDPLKINAINENYFQTSTGVISNKKVNDGDCTLFFSSALKDSPNRMEKAIATKKLDPFYNMIINANKNIAQVYFNSFDSMNRLCPFMDDALAQYPHDIDIPKYNFYYLADLTHNPKKEVVWTEAYLDPAGQGWMVSALAPIYRGDFLEGVVGIDVTIDKLITNMLSIKLPYKSSAMLVDKEGNILAMDSSLEPILGIKELKSHEYDKPVTATISKPQDFNLFKNDKNAVSAFLADAIKRNANIAEFGSKDLHFLLTQNDIPQTSWKLLLLLDKDSLLVSSEKLKKQAYMIGFIAIGGMILFYFIFLAWVLRRAHFFSQTILKPVDELIHATDKMKDTLKDSPLSKTPIEEFNKLLENFSSMSGKLRELYKHMDEQIKDEVRKNRDKDKHILQQSRLAQMGEMISMIAHQWRQPLGSISTVAASVKVKLALKKFDLSTEDGREGMEKYLIESVNKIEEYVKFLTTTIDDFRNFFKPEKREESVALAMLIDRTYLVVGKALEVNGITLERDERSKRHLILYSNETMQVILNLLKNAEDAIKERNPKIKKIWIRTYDRQDESILEVEDSAGGIDEKIMEKIFDPYFSTKEEKNGTGLGLYMCKTIIQDHMGGRISVENTENGALFRLYFKATKSSAYN
jgi:C4-dicarboxylate-specific signal transduction histidine kinase